MFSASNLSYSIKAKPILKDVTFNVNPGDFVALLGPNGSGKTTLLKILGGILRDYEGSALYNLLHINGLKPRGLAQTVAMVPQENYFLFPYKSRSVVLMGRYPHQKGRFFDSATDLQAAHHAMQLTDCGMFADRDIRTLSGGEKQRVLLARALAAQPKGLLLDEPGNHLDLRHQLEVFGLLSRLNKSDKLTVICVVHDLNLAYRYCNKVILLKEGRVVASGATEETLTEERVEEVFGVRIETLKSSANKSVYCVRETPMEVQ